MDTDTWTEITKPLIQRAVEPLKKVINDAKLSFDQLDEIEVVGSATRSPLVVNALKEFLGREPKRTLNSEEAVSKGCALCAAMVSPNFKVRDFAISDSCPYPIALCWTKEASGDGMEVDGTTGKASTIFAEHNAMPSTKMLTFMRDKAFDITASYAPEAALAPGSSADIGKFSISGIPPAEGPSKIKVKVRLNEDGVLLIESAHLVVEEVEEPKEEKPAQNGDTPMADAPAPAADEQPPAEGAAPTDDQPPSEPAGDAAAPAAAPAEEKAAEPEKKKTKVKKQALPVSGAGAFQLPTSTLESYKQMEYEMSVQDRQIKELQERRNDLEAYIYKMRDECSSGQLADFISAADKEKFMPLLDTMEDWLYSDEADAANKSLFISKLDELKVFGGPAEMRFKEDFERPGCVQGLQAAIDEYREFHASEDKAYEHITAEDRAKVLAALEEAETWLSTKKMEQDARAKHEPLVYTNADIVAKRDSLVFACRPIKMKPKPAPPKPDPKPDDKKDETAGSGEGQAAGGDTQIPDPAPEGDAAPAADAMEAEALD